VKAAAAGFDPAHPFGSSIARFDTTVDAVFERLRDNRAVDRVFYVASALADWSLIWHAIGFTQAVTDRRRVPDMVRLSAGLGVESLLVNQGVKRLFHRQRPVYVAGVGPMELRTPLTSSFPSGHASSAFFAAVLLARRQPRLAGLWLGLAGVVACSRIHVRMHHGSDVVVGAAIGATLGVVTDRLVPLPRVG
jgi:undecaprenyl-diphosphatase